MSVSDDGWLCCARYDEGKARVSGGKSWAGG